MSKLKEFNPQAYNFCKRWLDDSKHDKKDWEFPNNTPISDLFDSFFRLYIVYNNIYNLVCYKCRAQKNNGKKIGDGTKATTEIVDFIGVNTLFPQIEHVKYILQQILEQHLFIIENPDNDDKYLIQLKSKEKRENCIGTLRVLYKVRCNFFHGEKENLQYQDRIIRPLIELLQRIDTYLLEEQEYQLLVNT